MSGELSDDVCFTSCDLQAEAAAARSGCAQRLTALETKLEQLTRCMQLQVFCSTPQHACKLLCRYGIQMQVDGMHV